MIRDLGMLGGMESAATAINDRVILTTSSEDATSMTGSEQ